MTQGTGGRVPKSALFVASVFATAMPDHPSLVFGFLAMAVMVGISVAWYGIVVHVFTLRRVSDAYRQGHRWIDGIAGAVFVLFGARLVAGR